MADADDPRQSESSPPEPESQDAGEMAEQALGGAQKAVDALKGEAEGQGASEQGGEAAAAEGSEAEGPNVELPSFQKVLADVEESGIDLLHDVDLNVKIELGRTHMLVEDVLRLGSGSVVELDKLAGDPVDIYVNERLVARGEVLVLNENFCVRVSEIVAEVDEHEAGHQEADDTEAAAGQAGASDAKRSTGS